MAAQENNTVRRQLLPCKSQISGMRVLGSDPSHYKLSYRHQETIGKYQISFVVRKSATKAEKEERYIVYLMGVSAFLASEYPPILCII
jgi:hypothetical protein